MPLHPERVAWGILLIAFAIFCTLCVFTTIGVHYFLFGSTVPMDAQLQVGKGTVVVVGSDSTESAERAQRPLSLSSRISTDSLAQATLSFHDPYEGGSLIASVTVKGSTSFQLRDAARPRFEWNADSYTVTLANFEGELDVFVLRSESADRNTQVQLNVWTSTGHLIQITHSGRYIISASPRRVTVINQEGQATVISPDRQHTRSIPEGQQGVVDIANAPSMIDLRAAYVDLLSNSTFEEVFETRPVFGEVRQLAVSWACDPGARYEPPGAYSVVFVDGRPALHLLRADNATSHGATLCQQRPSSEIGDVSNYTFLMLRATFFIAGHSLSGCGFDASECPIMFRIDYEDINGRSQRWYQGFYTSNDTQLGYPLSCNSCTREHQQINAGMWYTFESDNLFAVLPPEQQPRVIISVNVYASGHQYDAYISEMSLFAGQTGG